ncbi:MAG: hypothetical protein WC002_05565, partial [Candidatus Muiribacteriota bacterium]
MINVLFFIESTDIGGTEQRFVNMANYLAQTGDFDLHFAYIREGVLHQNLNKTKIKNVQIPLTEKNIPGYFNSGKILAEYINENNIEIVYSGLIRTDIICFFSKFFTHFKLFGSLVSCYSMDYIKSSLKNLTEFLLRNFLHIFCYKIISNNKSGIKNFLFKKKFEYIPNYISSETV